MTADNRYLSDARLAALAASAEAKRVEAARVWASERRFRHLRPEVDLRGAMTDDEFWAHVGRTFFDAAPRTDGDTR
jgi:hypothetical protein